MAAATFPGERAQPWLEAPRRGLLSRTGSVLARIALLAVVSVLIGVCAGLLVLPVLGPPALAGKAVADQFNALPSVLVEPPLAQHSVLLDRNGNQLAVLHGAEDRVLVTRDQIPDVMKRAIVAVEDSRFYEHQGVDPRGLLRALVKNGQAGEAAQGGSTITQQYVKNVLLLSATTQEERDAATARSLSRKLQEARYAVELEKRLAAQFGGQAKDEILSRYLNITFFGQGVYGVGTASEHYFGHGVDQLTLSQAALLAGIVNSPSAYDPVAHPEASLQRRGEVLDRMFALGLITADEEAAANADPVLPADTPAKTAVAATDPCTDAGMYAFYCAKVRDILAADPDFGATADDRLNRIYNGGLTITAAVDPVVQKSGQDAVDGVVEQTNRISATAVTVQPTTGQVLSIALNRTFGPGDKDTPGVTQIDFGTTPVFQGGSTFKAFTLVAALEQKLPLTTSFFAPACYFSKKLSNPQFDAAHPATSCPLAGYTNADPAEANTYDLLSGTWYSVNTFFAQLIEKVGVLAAKQAALDMGVQASTVAAVGAADGSFTLGALRHGVSPVEMATAYATLANHGTECDPVYVLSVKDSTGAAVQTTQPNACHQVMDPKTADTVTGILRGVVTQPGATGTANGAIGRPAAGKTGTVDNEAAAWFVGYTPQLSTAVALGDPLHPNTSMGYVEGVSPVFGGTLPELIWNRTMRNASANLPVQDLAPAIGSAFTYTAGELANAPKVAYVLGLAPSAAQSQLQAQGYDVTISTVTVASSVAAGFVAGTDPAPGTPLLPGSPIVLYLSTGVPPPAATRAPASAAPPPSSAPPPSEAPSSEPPAPTTSAAP